MKAILSKTLIFFFFLLSTFYLLPSLAHASTTPIISPSPSAQTNPNLAPNTTPDVPKNLHNWTQNVMIEVMLSLTCQLVGVDPTQPNGQCLGVDQKTGKIGFLPAGNMKKGQIGGAIGGMSNMITMLYTPPIRTSDYFQNLASNFGIIKNAQAQVRGDGFDSLKPLLNLWTAFRNIVYLLFVLVFIVIGLAIMLRVKIDPRTVMTIQNQIPKIIIGILLVTFSFAIAGLLVDLMWVTIYLFFGIISGVPGVSQDSIKSISPTLQGQNPLSAWGITNLSTIIATVSSYVQKIFEDLIGIPAWLAFITKLIFGPLAHGPEIIAFVIILIAILVALFRLWLALLMSYIEILMDVVLAPFWILGSLVPGSAISAGGWLRDIVANLSVFPVTILMFLLGKVFVNAFAPIPPAVQPSNPFIPPLIGNTGGPEAFGSLIGIGIILMTPNVVSMMKAILKAPQVDKNTGLARAVGAPGGIIATTGHVGSTFYGLSYVPLVNRLPFLKHTNPAGVGAKTETAGGGKA